MSRKKAPVKESGSYLEDFSLCGRGREKQTSVQHGMSFRTGQIMYLAMEQSGFLMLWDPQVTIFLSSIIFFSLLPDWHVPLSVRLCFSLPPERNHVFTLLICVIVLLSFSCPSQPTNHEDFSSSVSHPLLSYACHHRFRFFFPRCCSGFFFFYANPVPIGH